MFQKGKQLDDGISAVKELANYKSGNQILIRNSKGQSHDLYMASKHVERDTSSDASFHRAN